MTWVQIFHKLLLIFPTISSLFKPLVNKEITAFAVFVHYQVHATSSHRRLQITSKLVSKNVAPVLLIIDNFLLSARPFAIFFSLLPVLVFCPCPTFSTSTCVFLPWSPFPCVFRIFPLFFLVGLCAIDDAHSGPWASSATPNANPEEECNKRWVKKVFIYSIPWYRVMNKKAVCCVCTVC